jgi:hypothetical protein
VISGRLLAEAIVAGQPATYPARLAEHPVLADYRRVFRLREAASRLRRRFSHALATPPGSVRTGPLSRTSGYGVSRAFAWMFSGARLPAPGLIDFALDRTSAWLDVPPLELSP